MGDRNATCYWKYPAIPFPTLQPNNGTASPDVPIQAAYATIAFGVSSILFALISTSIIGVHALRTLNLLRCCCAVMGLLTLGLGICNLLRVWALIQPYPDFAIINSLAMILFADLMIAITFVLGNRFHICGHGRRGVLFWLTVFSTIAVNGLWVAAIVLRHSLLCLKIWGEFGAIFDIVVRYCGPIAVFFAFCWAFAPIVGMKTGVDGMQSAVVAVGAWYLTGMFVFLILQEIMISFSMVRSAGGKTASINYNSASVYFRIGMLDFYCLPPSQKMIAAFRRLFFRSTRVHGLDESIVLAISQGGERLNLSPAPPPPSIIDVRANSAKTLIDPLPSVA